MDDEKGDWTDWCSGAPRGWNWGELEAVTEGAEECMALGDDDPVTEGSALGTIDGKEEGLASGQE